MGVWVLKLFGEWRGKYEKKDMLRALKGRVRKSRTGSEGIWRQNISLRGKMMCREGERAGYRGKRRGGRKHLPGEQASS